MKALALSRAAQADLRNIWRCGAGQRGLDQADRCTEENREACTGLASGSHTIYSRDRGGRLEIIRILHQSQDVGRNLPG